MERKPRSPKPDWAAIAAIIALIVIAIAGIALCIHVGETFFGYLSYLIDRILSGLGM